MGSGRAAFDLGESLHVDDLLHAREDPPSFKTGGLIKTSKSILGLIKTRKSIVGTLLYQDSFLNVLYGVREGGFDLGEGLHVDDLLHAREEVLVELLPSHDPVLVI